jgi:hypothetical protein
MVNYYGKATPANGTGSGGGSGDAVWGSITGTLSDQTDLAAALDAKQNVINENNKLNYNFLSDTPTIPTVPQNDNMTISLNASNKLQAIGFKEARTDTAMRVWHGTEQQWEQGGGQVKFYNWQNVSAALTTGTFPDYSGTDLAFAGFVEGNGVTILYRGNSDDYYITTDGINYTKHQFGMSNTSKSIFSGNGIFMLLLEDINPGCSVYTSTDGITWTATGGTISSFGYPTYCNGKWMINGDNKIFTSTDNGVTWTSIDVDFSTHRIAYGNNLYIAIKTNNDSNSSVKYSSDGENWNSYADTSFYCSQLVFTNGKFICMATNKNWSGNPSGLSYSTDNGETWSSLDLRFYQSQYVIKNNNLYMTHAKYVDGTNKPELLEINTNTMRISVGFIINSESLDFQVGACDNKILFLATKGVCGNLDLANTTILNAYTTDVNPTTESTVYSAPNVQSALTVTTGGSSSITLSDGNTYNYNQRGNQTTYTSVGTAHPNYICFIDNVGIKIGTTTFAQVNAS